MLTGISTRESAERYPYRPSRIVESVAELAGEWSRDSPTPAVVAPGVSGSPAARILGMTCPASPSSPPSPLVVAASCWWYVRRSSCPTSRALLTDVSDTLGAWTYLLVGGLAFLETGAFVGLIAPGETAIVLGGVVAASGRGRLVPVLLMAWVGAALGDLASFWLGRRLGRRFLHAHGPRVG